MCGADSLPGKIICLSKLRLDSVLPASAGGGPGWAVSSDVSNPAGACPSLQLAPCFSEIPQALGFLITSCAAATQQGVQGALQSCLHLIDTRKLENMKPPLHASGAVAGRRTAPWPPTQGGPPTALAVTVTQATQGK